MDIGVMGFHQNHDHYRIIPGFTGYLYGMSAWRYDTTHTAIASTISVSIIRTSASYFFGFVMDSGMAGIWMGIPADQISRFYSASIRFKTGEMDENTYLKDEGEGPKQSKLLTNVIKCV